MKKIIYSDEEEYEEDSDEEEYEEDSDEEEYEEDSDEEEYEEDDGESLYDEYWNGIKVQRILIPLHQRSTGWYMGNRKS